MSCFNIILLQMITEEDLQRVITDIEREQEEAKKSAEPTEGWNNFSSTIKWKLLSFLEMCYKFK